MGQKIILSAESIMDESETKTTLLHRKRKKLIFFFFAETDPTEGFEDIGGGLVLPMG